MSGRLEKKGNVGLSLTNYQQLFFSKLRTMNHKLRTPIFLLFSLLLILNFFGCATKQGGVKENQQTEQIKCSENKRSSDNLKYPVFYYEITNNFSIIGDKNQKYELTKGDVVRVVASNNAQYQVEWCYNIKGMISKNIGVIQTNLSLLVDRGIFTQILNVTKEDEMIYYGFITNDSKKKILTFSRDRNNAKRHGVKRTYCLGTNNVKLDVFAGFYSQVSENCLYYGDVNYNNVFVRKLSDSSSWSIDISSPITHAENLYIDNNGQYLMCTMNNTFHGIEPATVVKITKNSDDSRYVFDGKQFPFLTFAYFYKDDYIFGAVEDKNKLFCYSIKNKKSTEFTLNKNIINLQNNGDFGFYAICDSGILCFDFQGKEINRINTPIPHYSVLDLVKVIFNKQDCFLMFDGIFYQKNISENTLIKYAYPGMLCDDFFFITINSKELLVLILSEKKNGLNKQLIIYDPEKKHRVYACECFIPANTYLNLQITQNGFYIFIGSKFEKVGFDL